MTAGRYLQNLVYSGNFLIYLLCSVSFIEINNFVIAKSITVACSIYLRHRQIVEFYWHQHQQVSFCLYPSQISCINALQIFRKGNGELSVVFFCFWDMLQPSVSLWSPISKFVLFNRQVFILEFRRIMLSSFTTQELFWHLAVVYFMPGPRRFSPT